MALIDNSNLQQALTEFKNKYDRRIDNIDLRSTIGAELDYGYFTLSNKQTKEIALNAPIKFDVVIKNSGVELSNYAVKLKKGKTYNLSASIEQTDGSSAPAFQFFNKTDNVLIGRRIYIPSANYGSTANSGNLLQCIYEANKDCEITVVLIHSNAATYIPTAIGDSTTLIVEEIGRTYIVDPMDTKDTHMVETLYLTKKAENRQTLKVDDYLTFDTVVTDNTKSKIIYDYNKNTFTLKKGTYRVEAEITIYSSGTSSMCNYYLYNVTKNENTLSGTVSVSANYNTPSNSGTLNTIINVEFDTEYSIKISSVLGTPVAYGNGYTYLIIQEIAQPVVVEYKKDIYNEISNPLTITDISQETPVGSIIDYSGSNVPDHYLRCDGSVYNIEDYKILADHIKNTYGSYNNFGGDGISTFAVPRQLSDTFFELTPQMTGNKTPSPYEISASSIYNATYEAWKAFDNLASTTWYTVNNTVTGWIQIDFGKETYMNYFEIVNGTDATSSPKKFNLLGSNDGIDFTVIQSFDNQTFKASETKGYDIYNNNFYRYYRLEIKANNGRGNYSGFAEWKIYCKVYKFIKYEPTYYAVNQYGGFESKVLFDGNVNGLGSYQLSDSVENYDMVYILYETGTNTSANRYGRVNIYFPKEQADKQINIGHAPGNTVSYYVYGSATFSYDVMTIEHFQMAGYTYYSLYKIIGVKGQLPTLLQGGEF